MTFFDAIVLILVGGGAVRGAFRGFTYEILTLASWVIAIVALRLLFEPVAAAFESMLGSYGPAAIFAFVLIFAISFFGSRWIARRLGISVRRSFIGPADRILGFGFGALKWLIAVTLFFLFADLTTDIAYGSDAPRPEWMQESRSYPLLNASSSAIVDFVDERIEAEPSDEG